MQTPLGISEENGSRFCFTCRKDNQKTDVHPGSPCGYPECLAQMKTTPPSSPVPVTLTVVFGTGSPHTSQRARVETAYFEQ